MSEKLENALRDNQLASLGKLLATYTHDLKNHLAIINESSGLMADLLEMAGGEDDQTRQKFTKMIAIISERISQANTMAMHLNSLAHRLDLPTSFFNVNDLLTEELALIDRLAGIKNIILEKNLQEEIPLVSNNPSLLQFIILSLVNELIEKLAAGSIIRLSTQTLAQDIEVNIQAIGPCANTDKLADPGQSVQILQFAAKKMAIGFNQRRPEGNCLKTTLTLHAV